MFLAFLFLLSFVPGVAYANTCDLATASAQAHAFVAPAGGEVDMMNCGTINGSLDWTETYGVDLRLWGTSINGSTNLVTFDATGAFNDRVEGGYIYGGHFGMAWGANGNCGRGISNYNVIDQVGIDNSSIPGSIAINVQLSENLHLIDLPYTHGGKQALYVLGNNGGPGSFNSVFDHLGSCRSGQTDTAILIDSSTFMGHLGNPPIVIDGRVSEVNFPMMFVSSSDGSTTGLQPYAIAFINGPSYNVHGVVRSEGFTALSNGAVQASEIFPNPQNGQEWWQVGPQPTPTPFPPTPTASATPTASPTPTSAPSPAPSETPGPCTTPIPAGQPDCSITASQFFPYPCQTTNQSLSAANPYCSGTNAGALVCCSNPTASINGSQGSCDAANNASAATPTPSPGQPTPTATPTALPGCTTVPGMPGIVCGTPCYCGDACAPPVGTSGGGQEGAGIRCPSGAQLWGGACIFSQSPSESIYVPPASC